MDRERQSATSNTLLSAIPLFVLALISRTFRLERIELRYDQAFWALESLKILRGGEVPRIAVADKPTVNLRCVYIIQLSPGCQAAATALSP